jgi:CDP-paratose 2-epimerase
LKRIPSATLPPVRVLITGGAGFVGSNLACALAGRHEVVALDSLRRRGSELTLARLREAGAAFVHGDVREPGDLAEAGGFDALIECSAEPSALAGVDGARDFVVRTNLLGAYHCFEAAARHGAQVIFLSTSRVYPIAGLSALRLHDAGERYELADEQTLPGASAAGIAETFPLAGARTLYGATKLAAEHLLAEYDVPWVVNRCGVVAGPWQMGKVDQGVFTHWALSHRFGRPLAYVGFGGSGRQVRDLLHVQDLVELVRRQLEDPRGWHGATYNVGGGRAGSLSLRETTALCREIGGRELQLGAVAETRPGDVPVYLSDCTALFERTDWRPRRSPRDILSDIFAWIDDHADLLERTL